jgi:hypothetical protein
MSFEELRAELEGILALEEQRPVDRPEVKARCLSAIARLNAETEPAYPHDVVYHFLDDPDLRQKDFGYAEKQRRKLRGWLSENA